MAKIKVICDHVTTRYIEPIIINRSGTSGSMHYNKLGLAAGGDTGTIHQSFLETYTFGCYRW